MKVWRCTLTVWVLAGAASRTPAQTAQTDTARKAPAAHTAQAAARPQAAAAAQPPQTGYTQALEPRPLAFPADQGPHPDYRQEWWYLTGNLDSAGGERFGFELTIFRFALSPPRSSSSSSEQNSSAKAESSAWRSRQTYLGHFAVTDVARHQFRFTVKLSRGALGLAGARAEPFRVWVGNWLIGDDSVPEASSAQPTADATWRLQADGSGYALTLAARPLMPPVPNGERGLSRKSAEPGNASYYYSIPRVAVQGTIVRGGEPLAVHGLAWLDREWGSGSLGPQEIGWDWFGLQLDDGSSLMFYSLRDRNGTEDPYSAGTWIDSTGRGHPLSRSDVRIAVLDHWTDAHGARYPSRWRLTAPALGLDVVIHPILADQELVTSPRYWEGAVDLSGSRGGRKVAGRGYVELVGYARATAGSIRIR